MDVFSESSSSPGSSEEDQATIGRRFSQSRHPAFLGVRRRGSAKWVCEVRVPKNHARIWLGTFPKPEMAARAHDVAVLALRGKSAHLNFPDSAWRLAIPNSKDPKEIQKAALEAARDFGMENAATSSETSSLLEISDETPPPENKFFVDEEAVFYMPRLLTSMAEGMLLPPPHEYVSDDVERYDDMSLWSFPF